MFFEMLSAINDPNRQGSVDQLSQLTGSVQQLAKSQGLNTDQMGSMISALGGALQPALKQQSTQLGGNQLMNMLNEFTGGGSNAAALTSMIPGPMQQQIAQAVAAKTGMNPTMVQAMLPQLLTAAMGMFKMGAPKPGAPSLTGNPLLNAFLDSNRSGTTDLGDVMKFAGRFLNAPS
jgi:hypothetical protein